MGGCVRAGGRGAGLSPVLVAPQDSLDADRGCLQGLAPLHLQQGVVMLLQRDRHACGCPLHPAPQACRCAPGRPRRGRATWAECGSEMEAAKGPGPKPRTSHSTSSCCELNLADFIPALENPRGGKHFLEVGLFPQIHVNGAVNCVMGSCQSQWKNVPFGLGVGLGVRASPGWRLSLSLSSPDPVPRCHPDPVAGTVFVEQRAAGLRQRPGEARALGSSSTEPACA